MGTHPIFESDFDCLTALTLQNVSPPKYNFISLWKSLHGPPIPAAWSPNSDIDAAIAKSAGCVYVQARHWHGGLVDYGYCTRGWWRYRVRHFDREWREIVASDVTVAFVAAGAIPSGVQWENAADPSPAIGLGKGLSTLVAI